MVRTLFVRRYLRNVRSLNGSCNIGRCISLCSEIHLRTACAMCDCCTAKAPMEVEDGEDDASGGRGEGGADAPAARARPS